MVTSIRRRLVAVATAFVAAVGFAPEFIAHPHQEWEIEFARQVTVRSTASAPCAPTHHFDPAEIDVHPPCPACLFGWAGLGLVTPPATLVAGVRVAARPLPAAQRRPAASARLLVRGRAPPLV